MTGNFTLKSLIAAMQLELNWYSKHFPSVQKSIKLVVKKAIEGSLTDYDFDSFFSTMTHRMVISNDSPAFRRARNSILHILRLEDYNRENVDEHALVGYHNVVGDTEMMELRVTEEILSAADLTMVRRFYSDYNAPKDVPWCNSNPRFETLCWLADDVARRYPSGLQILIEEPRLTDEFSVELYREFDEIMGAMEKLNADPKFADDGSKGYRIGYHNSNYEHGTGDVSSQLRKLIDGISPDGNNVDSFEEHEVNLLSARDNSPEGYLVSELTSKVMIPSALKAIISASLTKREHDKSNVRGGGLTVVRPGYFADLDYDAVRNIYNEGITPASVDKVMAAVQYYVFIPARVDFEDIHRGGRLGFTSRKINSTAPATFGHSDSSDPLPRRHRATERKPISAYLDQLVDFDFASKNDGLLKVSAINGYYSYYRLLSNIVFKDFAPLLFGPHNDTDNKLKIRRQLTRIKNVPLRKVWELPLIVNPFRTPEEIFADLGYELHEVSEPNAKAEAPVRKPSSKRK